MKSLHQRLSLGIVTALGALLAVTALLSYPALRIFLRDEFDYALLSKARQLTAPTNPGASGFSLRFTDDPPPEFQPGPDAEFFEVRTADGNVFARSASLGNASLILRKSPQTGPVFFNVKLPGARGGRAVALRLTVGESAAQDDAGAGAGFIAVFARDTAHLRESYNLALAVFVGGGVVVLGLAAWLVHFATRRGLRPLSVLAGQVGQIHARQLDTRLSTRGLPTELHPIVGQLNHLMARLEDAFERERRFSANAAHELLTPVSELRAASENALQWRDDPAATNRLAEDTLGAAKQMERLIRALLTLANSDRPDRRLERAVVDLSTLTRETLAQFGERIAERKLSLESELPAEALIVGDRAASSSILQNLVDNAVEYTPAGGAIQCRLETSPHETRLIIANPNPGLEPAELARLWEPFWRRDVARSDRAHSGLGLALVQALARAQNFDVTASLPAPGRFQIEVRIPKAPDHALDVG